MKRLELKVTDLAATKSYNTLAINANGQRVYEYTPLECNDFMELSKYYNYLGSLIPDLDFLVQQVNNGDTFGACTNPIPTIKDIENAITDYCFNNFGVLLTGKINTKEYSKTKLSISFMQCCITIEYK